MVRIGEIPKDEITLVRTIAVAARPLKSDMNLSPLQAIDRLQKLHAKFQEHWISPPWLVLSDCYTLPANMPVAKMLEEISRHGQPIGIVGVVQLKATLRYSVLQMTFRKDKESRNMVAISAQAALNKVNERLGAIFSAQVFADPSGKTFSMFYSFHVNQSPEPGSKNIGTIMYTADGQVVCKFVGKQFAGAMEESKRRFLEVVAKLGDIQNAAIQK